ncbi:MAG: S8 family serine peptidase [Patescibacteria group bacterium]|jgi:subtilisin family serine protease
MNKLLTSFFIFILLAVPSVSAAVKPNDFYYGNQWYLSKIKADSAWDIISASPNIIVAVIDGRIQINHPDLRDNIWVNHKEAANNKLDDDRNGFINDISGWDFVDNSPEPSVQFDSGWNEAGVTHGTMIAGIIAASGNNEQGVSGVTWRAKIMPLRVLNDRGEGRVSDVVRAIDYAINNGANIINLSFVSFNYSEALQEAVSRAHKAGVIVVAAAGNEQASGAGYDIDQTPIYPACYDGPFGENMVIGVAATDALDQKAKFSSYGSRCVDIAAPGISFFSTVTAGGDINDPGKIYDGYWSGTSMAAPLVSATLALIEEVNPELSPREVVNILFASTDNISRLNPDYPGELGNGRLNVFKAVAMAKGELYSRSGRLVLATGQGVKTPKLAAANGDLVSSLSVSTFPSGSNFAAGDINDDGLEELAVASGPGREPQVKILNSAGKLLKQFLVFDSKFRGGVNVALSDLNGDGRAEIIATAASSGNGQVRIFNSQGKLLKQFLVDNKAWRGGLSLAVGDLDGRGQKEIVVGYGQGAAPIVKIFTPEGRILSSFYVYEKKFRGGVKVAVANIDGRRDYNKAEIIVAPGPGRESQIKIFDNRAVLKKQFLGFRSNWQGGVNLTAGDINNDGIGEIVVGAAAGASPHVRIFDNEGLLLESFYAWEESWSGGVNVGIININN